MLSNIVEQTPYTFNHLMIVSSFVVGVAFLIIFAILEDERVVVYPLFFAIMGVVVTSISNILNIIFSGVIFEFIADLIGWVGVLSLIISIGLFIIFILWNLVINIKKIHYACFTIQVFTSLSYLYNFYY